MRLTKKRLAQLDLALTLDDVLYERFRRLMEDLHRREAEFARRKQVVRVYQRTKNYDLALQILETHKTVDGLIVVCR